MAQPESGSGLAALISQLTTDPEAGLSSAGSGELDRATAAEEVKQAMKRARPLLRQAIKALEVAHAENLAAHELRDTRCQPLLDCLQVACAVLIARFGFKVTTDLEAWGFVIEGIAGTSAGDTTSGGADMGVGSSSGPVDASAPTGDVP